MYVGEYVGNYLHGVADCIDGDSLNRDLFFNLYSKYSKVSISAHDGTQKNPH